MKRIRRLLFLLATVFALFSVPLEASAIIGMPFTPMSYAGVARRTVRRTAYVSAAAANTAAITTLPPGCVVGVPCAGGVAYRQVYSGGTVVYVVQ